MRCEGGREAMNYPQRHSLAPIVRVLDSGTKPVHLIADDTQEYVAKHNRGREPCTWLRNELLAHAYARIWDLPTLEGAFMRVDPGHVGGQASTFCQPAYFKHTSFATRYSSSSSSTRASASAGSRSSVRSWPSGPRTIRKSWCPTRTSRILHPFLSST